MPYITERHFSAAPHSDEHLSDTLCTSSSFFPSLSLLVYQHMHDWQCWCSLPAPLGLVKTEGESAEVSLLGYSSIHRKVGLSIAGEDISPVDDDIQDAVWVHSNCNNITAKISLKESLKRILASNATAETSALQSRNLLIVASPGGRMFNHLVEERSTDSWLNTFSQQIHSVSSSKERRGRSSFIGECV